MSGCGVWEIWTNKVNIFSRLDILKSFYQIYKSLSYKIFD